MEYANSSEIIVSPNLSSDQPVYQNFYIILYKEFTKYSLHFFLCHQIRKVKEPCQRVGGQQYLVTDLLPLVAAAATRVKHSLQTPKMAENVDSSCIPVLHTILLWNIVNVKTV